MPDADELKEVSSRNLAENPMLTKRSKAPPVQRRRRGRNRVSTPENEESEEVKRIPLPLTHRSDEIKDSEI
jgi:hypothetical protein